MTRKPKGKQPDDAGHYGKAFEASRKLLEAESRLTDGGLSSSTRRRLGTTIDKQSAKLERLAERDREMTVLISEYLRDHDGKTGTYSDFHDWCAARGKLNDLDLRTIQYRLQKQYSAWGERGRPTKTSTKSGR